MYGINADPTIIDPFEYRIAFTIFYENDVRRDLELLLAHCPPQPNSSSLFPTPGGDLYHHLLQRDSHILRTLGTVSPSPFRPPSFPLLRLLQFCLIMVVLPCLPTCVHSFDGRTMFTYLLGAAVVGVGVLLFNRGGKSSSTTSSGPSTTEEWLPDMPKAPTSAKRARKRNSSGGKRKVSGEGPA